MRRHVNSVGALALVILGGCAGDTPEATPVAQTLGSDFGNAVHHNATVQIVDPAPLNVTNDPPPLDGNRAAAAVSRYRSGTMPALEIEKTTDSDSD